MEAIKNLLQGLNILVLGVLNDQSIAYEVAQQCAAQGATVHTTYLGSSTKRFDASFDAAGISYSRCDVLDSNSLREMAVNVTERFGGRMDAIVHCIASADPMVLQGRKRATAKDYVDAFQISAASFADIALLLAPYMPSGSSILGMNYMAHERYVENYGVMSAAKGGLLSAAIDLAGQLGPKGIRVNLLSPGAIPTWSSTKIKGTEIMFELQKEISPLRVELSAADVARVAIALISPLFGAVTGANIAVDGGFSIVGVPPLSVLAERFQPKPKGTSDEGAPAGHTGA